MNIYWKVLIITAVLAFVFKNYRKRFIIATTILHVFVCGFRYAHMHGDLKKYHFEFQNIKNYGWTSPDLLKGGRNSLFYIFNKLIAVISNDNFQVLLFMIALISAISIGIVIYYYSPMPFVSFMMWSCFGFYMFSFYSIKQTLAMAILMFAAIGLYENNPKQFYICTIIAGFIHFPAFVFLPAYGASKLRNTSKMVLLYLFLFGAIFVLKSKIVTSISDLYYDGETFVKASVGGISGKTLMMIGLLILGYLLCGLSNELVRKTFILISIASLLQIFSIFDNVFTRLADYYFQFIILYVPLMLNQVHEEYYEPPFYFNSRSQRIITATFICFALVLYYYLNMKGVDTSSVDNLMNFRFMWQG